MLRLDRLRAFLAFAETGSFTAAADRIGLSQPALHTQIGNLGDELGVPLYRRDGRGVVLTDEGEQLAAFARELDARTTRFVDQLHGRDRDQPVVLCAGEASSRHLLLPALAPLLADGLTLQLRIADAEGTVDAVASGRAQVGVTVVGAVPRSLVRQPLTAVPAIVALPAGHPLAERSTLDAQDLAGQPLVLPPTGRPHRTRLEQALDGVDWTVASEVQGWELAVQLVGLGLGLAVVNAFVPLPDGVVGRPFTALDPVVYTLLRRRHAPRVPAVDRLVTALEGLAP